MSTENIHRIHKAEEYFIKWNHYDFGIIYTQDHGTATVTLADIIGNYDNIGLKVALHFDVRDMDIKNRGHNFRLVIRNCDENGFVIHVVEKIKSRHEAKMLAEELLFKFVQDIFKQLEKFKLEQYKSNKSNKDNPGCSSHPDCDCCASSLPCPYE
jgi:predicted RNase H-like HicB family nuclease